MLLTFVLLSCFLQFIIARQRDEPPYPKDVVKMARYIVKETDWVAMSTISTKQGIAGFPFVTLQSISDGAKSTGIPYFYMTDRDISAIDMLKDNRLTIMCSLEEVGYCKTQDLDPQDPRCAKVMITGRYVKVPKTSQEYEFAKLGLFAKHPHMATWPEDHEFYVAKMDINQITLLDSFGGVKFVPLEDYLRGYSKKSKFVFIGAYNVNRLK